MQANYGYAGKILFVDLTSGKIREEALTIEDAKTWLGGMGIGTKLLYEMTRPGIDPLGPENVLTFSIGPWAGTIVPGAAKCVITAKSPLTKAYGVSTAGHFGTMLKFAGYDHIVFTGRAEKPVWLRIIDDEVTLVDAEHLWGRDTFETTDAIWESNPEAWVACIGPAGENMVLQANVMANKYAAFGLTGMGAVMGSKRLKAIGVYGTKSIKLADPAGFIKTAVKVHKEVMNGPWVKQWREIGTLIQFQDYAPGALEARKQQGSERPGYGMNDWTDKYTNKLRRGTATCPSCPVGCKARLEVDEGRYKGTNFVASCPAGTVHSMKFGIPNERWDGVAKIAEMSNRWGLSTLGISSIVGFAFQLWEDGVITKEDMGFELKRDDPESILELMRQISYRQGFGDILAERFESMRDKIGKGALEYALPIKGWFYAGGPRKTGTGQPLSGWDLKGSSSFSKWDTVTFGSHISPRGPQFNHYSSITMMPGRSGEALKRYCERTGIPQEEIGKIVTGEVDGFDVPTLTRYVELYNLIMHSVGECQRPFMSRALDMETVAQLLTTSTGIDFTVTELQRIAERIITLIKLYNLEEGLTKEDDLFPEGYLAEEYADEAKNLQGMVEKYYEVHDWDPETGQPSPRTIDALGLNEMRKLRVAGQYTLPTPPSTG